MTSTQRTLIIAEAGVNHNGDFLLAKKLVDVSKDAGADIIKFQTFQANQLATNRAEKAEYQKQTSGISEGQLEMLKRLELSPEQHEELIRYCNQIGIEFLSTAFDLQSIELLMSLNPKRWKIPSGEITNLPYLRQIGRLKKQIILSTGMANLGEIEAALKVLEEAGTPRSQITVLHCTTDYPAAPEEVNLRAMQSIASSFGVAVGYSDHTDGIAIPISAVAMGAVVIEKHVTLDRTMMGPDHQASLEPDQFKNMVQGIRSIEVALGDGIKRKTPSERKNLTIIRKSLVASRPIQAGECFSEFNLTSKRPGNGISPMHWDEIMGRRAIRDFRKDELIEW